MLKHGYQTGLLWRVVEENILFPAGLGIYVTSFYDPGLACPYPSLGTLLPLLKYGDSEAQRRFVPKLLQKDAAVWQGATWITEIKGGSDLGTLCQAQKIKGDRHCHLLIASNLEVVDA